MDVFHQVSLARSAPMRGDGQGEGLLFTSYDRTLIVKQISSEEVADMHNILSEYHQVSHNIAVRTFTVNSSHVKCAFNGIFNLRKS